MHVAFRFSLFGFICILSLWTSPAFADDWFLSKGQSFQEISHQVFLSVNNGIATMRVRRVIQNDGDKEAEAWLSIKLPHGAIVTSLRTLNRGKWSSGQLLHHKKAIELYRNSKGGAYGPRVESSLLFWQDPETVNLRVFPIQPHGQATLEYTLNAPTEYRDGQHLITYPRKSEDNRLATPLITFPEGHFSSIDGISYSSSAARLPEKAIESIARKYGELPNQVLVSSLKVLKPQVPDYVAIDINVEHTWSGDLRIQLIDPTGANHVLHHPNYLENESLSKKRYFIEYGKEYKGTWRLLLTDCCSLDTGRLKRWAITPATNAEYAQSKTQKRRIRLGARSKRKYLDLEIPQIGKSQPHFATLGLSTPTTVRERFHTSFRVARVNFPDVPQFARIEIDVAQQLSELPENHVVTFVIDRSHTIGSEGIDSQIRMARAYLTHVPDAHFNLIAFARKAHLLSKMIPATDFESEILRLEQSGEWAPRNGSFLDRGVQKATELLIEKKSNALLLFTDNRLRNSWNNDLALNHIKSKSTESTVHLVDIRNRGCFFFQRSDNHRLSPLAQAGGGVAVRTTGTRYIKTSELNQEVLYLVRPTRIENLAYEKNGQSIFIPEILAEGEGIRWMDHVTSAPKSLTITGKLWSRSVTLGSSSSERLQRLAAGYVFPSKLYHKLNELQQYLLATYARALSPMTSYATLGKHEETPKPKDFGFGSGFSTSFPGTQTCRTPYPTPPSAIEWKPIVERIRNTCSSYRKDTDSFSVTVETQNKEISNIIRKRNSKAYDACVIEELWRTNLAQGIRGNNISELSF